MLPNKMERLSFHSSIPLCADGHRSGTAISQPITDEFVDLTQKTARLRFSLQPRPVT